MNRLFLIFLLGYIITKAKNLKTVQYNDNGFRPKPEVGDR